MNPHIVDNGIYSQSHHASRDDLRNALDEKRVTFLETPDFWTKLLLTESVPSDTVESIHETVQVHLKKLISLAADRNPLESKMYPPLDAIFRTVKKQNNSSRVWKDHHTKYPGVDSGVFISGLHGKDPASTQLSSAHSEKSDGRGRAKRLKVEGRIPTSINPEGSDGGASSDDDDDDSYRARKTPSQFGKPSRVFDPRKPDYILLDTDYQGCCPEKPLWRQIAVIMELKALRSCAPSPAGPGSSLIVQCTDYARLHMSLRPFQRFSILFSLCGTLFTAVLIDRVGVIISNNVDISKPSGVRTFIRALVRVTCNMSIYDLGMDPTVSLNETSAMGDSNIPRFVVTVPSKASKTIHAYITRGIPIWQSSSVFGRGTVVWNVDELSTTSKSVTPEGIEKSQDESNTLPNSSLILKSAYRNKERIGESEFYRAIQSAKIDGLAVFRAGGDIHWDLDSTKLQKDKPTLNTDAAESRDCTNSSVAISTALHRTQLGLKVDEDSIAHRLVLESKGKRLSEYENLCGLLNAVLACVKGHEALYANGILHRDISIGNVFISDSDHSVPSATQGFLADLDMAKVYDEAKLAGLIGEESAKLLVKSTTGSITGTAQFMSLSLLYEHANQDDVEPAERPIVPMTSRIIRRNPQASQPPQPANSPLHDLESFVWVLFYALCLKEMDSKPSLSERETYCRKYFIDIFGMLSFRETMERHTSIMRLILDSNRPNNTWKRNCISDADAWPVLEDLMQAASAGTLSYKEFKDTLQFHIEQLKQVDPAQP
ncbi:hypothetical protein M408DRAFT_235221 [Serendipita vermifera MAFF 305830]|uniref:Fungal-type protein kinase domain-containing protein n=1 Tax=Serendipita vermifera MAFF 305830 TaxID=933852 RepID=A0A0C3BHC2_SERVB|nr:hypothetical protein M408DRAFT_235221 [Serendipita vermifera MAFF 305830]